MHISSKSGILLLRNKSKIQAAKKSRHTTRLIPKLELLEFSRNTEEPGISSISIGRISSSRELGLVSQLGNWPYFKRYASPWSLTNCLKFEVGSCWTFWPKFRKSQKPHGNIKYKSHTKFVQKNAEAYGWIFEWGRWAEIDFLSQLFICKRTHISSRGAVTLTMLKPLKCSCSDRTTWLNMWILCSAKKRNSSLSITVSQKREGKKKK